MPMRKVHKPKGDIILVTGSNGRIGTAVMRRLSEEFDNVVGFDLKAPSPPPPGCTRIPVDITSDQSVEDGLFVLRMHHGKRIAAVIHLAAIRFPWCMRRTESPSSTL